MTRGRCRVAALVAALVWLSPAAARAQAPAEATAADRSRLWIVAGGNATTLQGDCQECEQPGDFIHGGSFLVGVGRRVNGQMDAGLEVLFVPATSPTSSHIRSTFITAAAQYRPWASRGVFSEGWDGHDLRPTGSTTAQASSAAHVRWA